MNIVLDTHAWVWAFFAPDHLSQNAIDAIKHADARYISPVSIYEVAQKVRLGKWPDMEGDKLAVLLEQDLIFSATITNPIALLAGALQWDHRDPFDRMLAATAITMDCALVSKDTQFDQLKTTQQWTNRIW